MKSSRGASESKRCIVGVKPRSTQHTEHYAKCELTCDFDRHIVAENVFDKFLGRMCRDLCERQRFFGVVLKNKTDGSKIGGID